MDPASLNQPNVKLIPTNEYLSYVELLVVKPEHNLSGETHQL
jgi:hypothetical protein